MQSDWSMADRNDWSISEEEPETHPLYERPEVVAKAYFEACKNLTHFYTWDWHIFGNGSYTESSEFTCTRTRSGEVGEVHDGVLEKEFTGLDTQFKDLDRPLDDEW